MVDPRCVEYIRTNKEKYPLEALKAALLKAGVTPADVEEAVRLAAAPPPREIPVTAPPVQRPPASFAEIFPASRPASPAPTRETAPSRPAPQPLPPGLLPRMRAVLLSPAVFFRSMPRGGGWREPMLFALSMALACAVLQIGLGLAFGTVGLGPSRAAATLLAAVFSVLGTVVASLIGTLLAAGIAHLIWVVLGSRQPFQASLRCVAFMTALMPVLAAAQAVPVAGPWLAVPLSLYGVYLLLPASIEVHEVQKKKAAAVVLGLGTVALLATLAVAFGAFRLRRAAQGRPPSLMEASSTAARSLPPLPNAPVQGDLQQQVMSQLAKLQAQAAAPGGAGQPPTPEQALQTMNAALGAIAQTGGAAAVSPESLRALLPERIAGLARTDASAGKQQLGPMETAMAQASYKAPDGGLVSLQIVDSGGASGLLSMALSAAGSRGAATYKSFPAAEQYDPGSRSGTFQVLCAGRFAVKVSGQGVDQKVLRSAMDAVDLDALKRLTP